jgi:Protein of unknown function/Domain of unknown function (DUF1835)
MIYHITTGEVAARQLKAATGLESGLEGEVHAIKDMLHMGPLKQEHGQKFSDLRTEFWRMIAPAEKTPIAIDDLEQLLSIGNALSRESNNHVWYWQAATAVDVCTAAWLCYHIGKYRGQVHLINIAGLPFLDEEGKLFFPAAIGDIPPKEILKAKKLVRPITVAEAELMHDEWQRLSEENGMLRTYDASRKITTRNEDYFDGQLKSLCTYQFQKASKIAGMAMVKSQMPLHEAYVGWRLCEMAKFGALQMQGDSSRGLREYEVKLPGEGAGETIGLQ